LMPVGTRLVSDLLTGTHFSRSISGYARMSIQLLAIKPRSPRSCAGHSLSWHS
jgi:hypothetical protein